MRRLSDYAFRHCTCKDATGSSCGVYLTIVDDVGDGDTSKLHFPNERPLVDLWVVYLPLLKSYVPDSWINH
jgi:hypothetical protein